MVLFLANFLKGSLQDEIDQLFQAVFKWDVAKRLVTRSAVSQARRKIKHGVFIALQDLIGAFLDVHAPLKTFLGKRVFAIDGSTVRVPDTPVMRRHFGAGTTKDGAVTRALARASVLFDVLNRQTRDVILGRYSDGEHGMAFDHLEKAVIPDNSLILMDRGYINFLLLREIVALGHDFVIRAPSGLKVVRLLNRSGSADGIFLFKPSPEVARLLDPEDPWRRGIRVRLVRRKAEGEPFHLMTTLTRPAVSAQALLDLYHRRWAVEESYKAKKCRLMSEEFLGTTPELVCQDFHGKMLAESLTEALTIEVVEAVAAYSEGKKWDYKTSFAQALAKMKNTLVLLFLRSKPAHLIDDLLLLFTQNLTAIIPGRSYSRDGVGNSRHTRRNASFSYRLNR